MISTLAICAWVLWITVTTTLGSQSWPIESMPTYRDCKKIEERRRRVADEKEKSHPNPDKAVDYVCLPDTVDPREPKGSGK